MRKTSYAIVAVKKSFLKPTPYLPPPKSIQLVAQIFELCHLLQTISAPSTILADFDKTAHTHNQPY